MWKQQSNVKSSTISHPASHTHPPITYVSSVFPKHSQSCLAKGTGRKPDQVEELSRWSAEDTTREKAGELVECEDNLNKLEGIYRETTHHHCSI